MSAVICNHCGKLSHEHGGVPICCFCGRKISEDAQRVRDSGPSVVTEDALEQLRRSPGSE